MKTAGDHEPNLAFAAVGLAAESGVATILTGKSQSGSRTMNNRASNSQRKSLARLRRHRFKVTHFVRNPSEISYC